MNLDDLGFPDREKSMPTGDSLPEWTTPTGSRNLRVGTDGLLEYDEVQVEAHYEQHLAEKRVIDHGAANPLAWLSQEQGLKHAISFYKLGVREQHVLGLVGATLDALYPIIPTLPSYESQEGMSASEQTAGFLGVLIQHRALFKLFHQKVLKEDLLPGPVLRKQVQVVRASAMGAGAMQGFPWAMVVWASLTENYQLALQALVGGNFDFYAQACVQMMAPGLAAMDEALREWDEAGRPLTVDGGGAQAPPTGMPAPARKKRED
jgi:hypothetical protein